MKSTEYPTLLFSSILLSLLFPISTTQAQDTQDECAKIRLISLVYQTDLQQEGPAPQSYEPFDPVQGSIEEITYPSFKGEMKALLDTRHIRRGQPGKVLVYLHGGFALSYADMDDCQPFVDEGFIVFAPSFRGENGNPGSYEMMFGEVKDAVKAIRWIAEQPFTHPDSIYVFGHSIGGAISLALSQYDNLPIRLSGSSAGIYAEDDFTYWAELDPDYVPFSITDESEMMLRLPILFLECMVRPHLMYLGTDDDYAVIRKWVEEDLYPTTRINLKFNEIPGDHSSSLRPSIKAFMQEIKYQR
ncbi:MAG: alpha/beta fold hydrolase [Bacteroidota bacterium]